MLGLFTHGSDSSRFCMLILKNSHKALQKCTKEVDLAQFSTWNSVLTKRCLMQIKIFLGQGFGNIFFTQFTSHIWERKCVLPRVKDVSDSQVPERVTRLFAWVKSIVPLRAADLLMNFVRKCKISSWDFYLNRHFCTEVLLKIENSLSYRILGCRCSVIRNWNCYTSMLNQQLNYEKA